METYNLKVNISSDVSSFVGGLSSIGGELQGLEREVNQTVERVESSFSKLGKNLTKVGAGLTAGLTVPLTMMGKNIWDDGMEFDEQMARVKAIGQLQEEQYNRLKDQSIQVGADTIFGATDVAIAQEGMLKKGFTVDEVMVSIPGIMSLATLDDSRDVDLASSTMSSIINAYGMDKSDESVAERVSDIIAQGTISSGLNVRDISNAMSFVGTEADSFNVSLEETTALLGILADRNIDSTKGGTTLRNVFNRLRTPTGKAGDALEELGVSAYDSSGKVRPLFEIMEDLNKAMEGMSDQQIDRYMKDIFETEAMAGARILLESLDDVKELTKVLEDSGGAAQKVSDDIMDSGSGAVEEAMGAIESANVAMFNALAPMIVKIANLIEKLADAFTNLPEPVQRALGYLGIFLWGIGPALSTIGLAITGLEKLAGMFKLFSGAGTVVGGGTLATVASVVATILAVIVAGWTLTANWDKIKEKFGEITGKIGDNFGKFVDRIQPDIDKLTGGFADLKDKILTDFPQLEKAIDGFSRVFEGFGTVLSGVWETIKGLLKLNFSSILLGIVGVGGFIRGLFTGEWDGFFDAVEDITGWVHDGTWGMFGGLGTIFEGLGDIELGKGEVIIGLLDGLWTTFTDWTNDKWEGLIIWVATKLDELLTPIITWWANLKDSLSTWWEGIKAMVQGWYDNSIGRLITWLTTMWNEFIVWKDNVLLTIQEWWDGVVEKFTSLPATVRTHVDEFKETVSSGFEEAVDKAVEWVRGLPGRLLGFWDDMKSAGSSLVSGFISGLRSNAEGIWSAARDMASNALNSVKSRLDINSPSGVGIELGGFFGEGLIRGINGTYGDVRSVSEGLANVISGQFGGNIGGFTEGINGMIAHSVGASVNVDEFEQAKQPIIIQTRFGNEDYEVYVDDITRQQDKKSWIRRR